MQHQKAIVKKKVPEGEVLAETAGSPQRGSILALSVCSLRSQPPVLHFVTCGDISPRSGENLSPTGGRLQWRPAALPHCQCLPPLGERLPRSGGGGTKCQKGNRWHEVPDEG